MNQVKKSELKQFIIGISIMVFCFGLLGTAAITNISMINEEEQMIENLSCTELKNKIMESEFNTSMGFAKHTYVWKCEK